MNVRLVWLGLCLCFAGAVHAQALRDPTQAPPAATPSAGDAATPAGPLGSEGVAVVVRDGKPFLVSGTRLYGVGQKLGAYRIERITETDVWLRNGAELRKEPRFAGITRKESKSPPTTSFTSPKAASRAGAQP